MGELDRKLADLKQDIAAEQEIADLMTKDQQSKTHNQRHEDMNEEAGDNADTALDRLLIRAGLQ